MTRVSASLPTSFLLAIVALALLIGPTDGQVSPEEHAQHHPEQAESSDGENGGMMEGGMMGGMMSDMMEKMGAPQPKELYPKLMDLPDLPLEERFNIEQEAHQRMMDGTRLLSSGLDELVAAAGTDDFQSMRSATAKMREGLAQFESGLAAHQAIAEGKAPRNVALQWFKREMNLQPSADVDRGFRLFGMTAFHTALMAVLIAFAVAMIWMYFFKMRRATELMQQLATTVPAGDKLAVVSPANAELSAISLGATQESKPLKSAQRKTTNQNPVPELDCCDASSPSCAAQHPIDPANMSAGLLRVAKRKLCKLRVAKIFQETANVKTFRLVSCHGGALPFSYLPGQFLTLKLPLGEKPIRRSYTISSSPTQGFYCEIAVKREAQGAGSCYLHDRVGVGDLLEVQAPSGKFTFTGKEADSVVLIAGGVGITPMVSITRALTDMGWQGEIFLIVACRDPAHFIFRDELERLQLRHPNLHVHAAMSRLAEPTNGYHAGRLTRAVLAEWVPGIESRWIQLCGAPPMMKAVQQMLAELGVSAEHVHTENFGSQQKPRAISGQLQNETLVSDAGPAEQSAPAVRFAASGKSTLLRVDETVLEAAEREGVDIDYSCRTGMCGICRVKLIEGRVTMEIQDGLEPEDQAEGMILACQAKSSKTSS